MAEKSSIYGGFVPREGSHLETVLYAIFLPNIQNSIALSHVCPLQHIAMAGGGQKWLKNQAFMTGQFQGKEATWKPFYAPYYRAIYRTSSIWAIFALSRHVAMAGEGQKWMKKQVFMASQFQGKEATLKPYYAPYYLPKYRPASRWAIFDLSRYIAMAGGGQKWLKNQVFMAG